MDRSKFIDFSHFGRSRLPDKLSPVVLSVSMIVYDHKVSFSCGGKRNIEYRWCGSSKTGFSELCGQGSELTHILAKPREYRAV